ncbi:hypothetical protein N7510_006248 [Penicillium lagena]|uniref:uncharacterized protein n=1 Tax=Penicillium lagena TaxID=94218 RepID=UPI00254020A7|nr:uncharacterized protein N7510_006248 [Penicillium lagena]KAJ5613054.1 hypothetical protein N7510_006248 [Penicillium lagena]
MLPNETPHDLHVEAAQLETRLQDIRARLAADFYPSPPADTKTSWNAPQDTYKHSNNKFQSDSVRSSSLHALLLLSDSALPLGSFAYSSGLESYLAHNKPRRTHTVSSFHRFLRLSIASICSTSVPYVLAGYRQPSTLETLDNDLDAFAGSEQLHDNNNKDADVGVAVCAIDDFSEALKSSGFDDADDLGPNGHFAPLWGCAAVRASVMGPYQAQSVLASQTLQDTIMKRIRREWHTEVEQAGQVVPALDLWVGRHELLYSRIFNS